MKGKCPECKEIVDETEFIQEKKMCIRCFEKLIKKQKEIEMLCELTRKMVDVQIEKLDKYKEGWKSCELIELKAKLVQKANSLFLLNSMERLLRDLVHIGNYAYFLYYRLRVAIDNSC